MLGIQLIIMGIAGVVAAAIASSKGRSVAGWFFGGFFLGLIGIIVVAVLPNLKEEQAKRESEARERHRLREQLRQEQIKSETYRRYATVRLDAHDQALGLDTRSLTALPQSQAPAALPGGQPQMAAPGEVPPSPLDELTMAVSQGSMPAAPGAAQAKYEPAIWYYEELGKPRGPVTASALRNLAQSGIVGANTLVWCEALGNWTPAAQVPPLGSLVRT